MKRMQIAGAIWCAVVFALIVPGNAAAVVYPFADGMEDSLSGIWCFDEPWGYTDEAAHGGSLSITDSPGDSTYDDDISVSATLCTSIDLTSSQMPVLTFWHRYALEANEDYGYVDVSDDGGSSWTTVYFVTGSDTMWKQERIDLSDFVESSDVRIRFRLDSNGSVGDDGWYIDDVSMAETLNPLISYPFLDDMEGGVATEDNWHSSSWALIDTVYQSDNHSWTDSPVGNYPHVGFTDYTALTLAGVVDLTTAECPELSFWHRYDIYNHGYVEVSSDSGKTWVTVRTYVGLQADWTLEHVDLSAYGPYVRVRFVLELTNYFGDAEGWYVDDVRIDQGLSTPFLEPPTNVTMHGAELCWHELGDGDFARYEVYRKLGPGASLLDELVYVTADSSDTCFSDAYCVFEPDYYYYVVYAVDTLETYSCPSNEEQALYVVPQMTYPFFDDMESGPGNWEWCGGWDITDEAPCSGDSAWSDSPDGLYGDNVNAALTTAIDLSSAQMPVLTFRHSYSLEANEDYGYVDVSDDGGSSWTTVYFVTGSDTLCKEERIDLSQYAGSSDARIRFRLESNGSVGDDGWYIDDVSIAETLNPLISYPFFDDMEGGEGTEGNWHSSSWALIDSVYLSADSSWTDSPVGNYPDVGFTDYTALTLAGVLDLTTAECPELSFWHRYDIYNHGYVEVSSDSGRTWVKEKTYAGTQGDWARGRVDLTGYGDYVRVRFRLELTNYFGDAEGWYIDDVRVDQGPTIPVLEPLTNVTRHGADLCWSQSPDGDFARYEIYRKKGSGVSASDELVYMTMDAGDTCYSDTYCILQPDYYYYAVYAVDTLDTYSCPSNEEQALYVVPQVSYPFFDDMESGPGNWEWCEGWDITDEAPCSGDSAWSDSPSGEYVDNVNTAISTEIDLSSAQMPVLTFWHSYSLEANEDFGYVDISDDGGLSWTTVYFVTGAKAVCEEERIDLSDYAGFTDVGIRFRLKSNGSVVDDGWYIDDVSIAETLNPLTSYPFFDDMEGGAATEVNWHSSSWGLIDAVYQSENHAWADSPEGNYPHVGFTDYTALTLSGVIDLSGAECPELSYWHRYEIYNRGFVEVSSDSGRTWVKEKTYMGTQGDWARGSVDLSGYGDYVRVRFRLELSNYFGNADGWFIDGVGIQAGACARVDSCSLESPDSTSTSPGVPTEDIFGLVFESGVTESPGQGAGLAAEVGYGPDGVPPWESSWTWVAASYDSDDGDNDRYVATLTVPDGGIYDYTYRFMDQTKDNVWTYADLDGNDLGSGGTNDYDPSQSGHLDVSRPEISVSPLVLEFTVACCDSADSTIVIKNTGTDTLTFEIQESLAPPGSSALQPVAASAGVTGPGGAGAHRGDPSYALNPNPRTGSIARSAGRGDATSQDADNAGVLTDIPWLSADPTAGTIPPGDSTVVTVTVKLEPGDPTDNLAYLVILSNDPLQDTVPVEIQLHAELVSGPGDRPWPNRYTLAQNVPNPFFMGTAIRYGLPVESHVRLEVFDVLGRRVATLRDKVERAGWHTVEWDGSGLPSGVYFYRLQAGEVVITKRMCFVR